MSTNYMIRFTAKNGEFAEWVYVTDRTDTGLTNDESIAYVYDDDVHYVKALKLVESQKVDVTMQRHVVTSPATHLQ